MSWARLDDGFFRHPKARAAGKDGRALFMAGLCWAAAHLTDGFIATADLGLVAAEAEVRPKATATRLVDVGLWEPVEGGWRIHDYLDFNPTAEAEKEKRRKRAEAGRKGGLRSRPPASKQEANASANAQSNGQAKPEQNGSESEPRPRTPTEEPTPSLQTREGPSTPAGGIIDEAVQLAAKRYADHEREQGRGRSADGLARWWLQENAGAARIRAQHLLEGYDLRATQLADALLQPSPRWLSSYRRHQPEAS